MRGHNLFAWIVSIFFELLKTDIDGDITNEQPLELVKNKNSCD